MTVAGRLPVWSPERRALLRARVAAGPAAGGTAPPVAPAATSAPSPAPAPPRDALEARLLAIWTEVLGAPAGIRQSFFDLGGDSLLAVRLFAEIWRAFDRELPLSTILEAPTVELLARVLRRGGEPSSVLVPMQPGGTQPPLFCVHQHSGQIFCYQAMARHLGPDQPVYGITPPAGRPAAGISIESMAAGYAEAIRALEPTGPYYLVGYCFGGTVAFEIARQLHAAGHRVGLLALIEASRPDTAGGALRWMGEAVRRVSFEVDVVAHLPRDEKAIHLAVRAGQAVGRARGLLAWRPGRTRPGAPPASPAEREIHAIAAAHESALRRYTPHPYPGRITLYKPGRRSGRHYGTLDLGWGGLAGGGITVHEIPCDQPTVVDEPAARALAAALAGALRAAGG